MTLLEQDELIEKSIKLVYYSINKFYPTYNNNDDIISCGMLGLVKAARTFDQTKGIKFSSYAVKCIKNEIRMYFRKESKFHNIISLDDDTYKTAYIDTIMDEHDYFSEVDTYDLILSFKKILTEREFDVFMLYYKDGLTQQKIGELYNTTRSNISNILVRSRIKIRKEIK